MEFDCLRIGIFLLQSWNSLLAVFYRAYSYNNILFLI